MTIRHTVYLYFLMAIGSTPTFAQTSLQVGAFATHGDYGHADATTVKALNFGVKSRHDNLTYKASAALLSIQGPGNVDTGIILPEDSAQTRGETGFGDVMLSATYSLPAAKTETLFWDVTAKLKIPTADEDRGLGTGGFDLEGRADVAKRWQSVIGFAGAGYKWRGDGDQSRLENTLNGNVGLDTSIANNWRGGFTFSASQAATSYSSAPRDVMFFVTDRLAPRKTLTFWLMHGFTDGSPDLGAGLQYSTPF